MVALIIMVKPGWQQSFPSPRWWDAACLACVAAAVDRQARRPCLVWCGGVNWVGPTSAFSVGVRPAVALRRLTYSDLEQTQNAPVWRSSRLNSHQTRQNSAGDVVSGVAVWIGQLLITCSDFTFSPRRVLSCRESNSHRRSRRDSFVVALWISFNGKGYFEGNLPTVEILTRGSRRACGLLAKVTVATWSQTLNEANKIEGITKQRG